MKKVFTTVQNIQSSTIDMEAKYRDLLKRYAVMRAYDIPVRFDLHVITKKILAVDKSFASKTVRRGRRQIFGGNMEEMAGNVATRSKSSDKTNGAYKDQIQEYHEERTR